MLNGKTKFVIQNIPEKAVLLRFNVLFAYVYDTVSGGKGMMLLKIELSKNQTIASIMKVLVHTCLNRVHNRYVL